jgi:hypothetical protein
MALLFTDGFDHYTNPADKWSSVSAPTGTLTIASGSARAAQGHGLTVQQGIVPSDSQYLEKEVVASSQITVGFAFKTILSQIGADAQFTDGTFHGLLAFMDGVSPQVIFGLNGIGQIQGFIGTPGATPPSSSGPVATSGVAVPLSGVWSYLEFIVRFSSSIVGSILVRLNGTTVISLPSIRTSTTTNQFSDRIRIGHIGNTATRPGNTYAYGCTGMSHMVDDLYILNNIGAQNNAPLGDIRVATLMPLSDGPHTGFSVAGATAHADALSEIPPDGGTSYVAATAVGSTDFVNLHALPRPGALRAVQVGSYSKSPDGSATTMRHVIRDSVASTSAHSPAAIAVTPNYTFTATPFDQNTNQENWTSASLATLQAGIEVIS